MNRTKAPRRTIGWAVLYAIYGVTMSVQLCLLFLLRAGPIGGLRIAGWALLVISAVLGWVPILTFRRRGGVARRKSYMHTTKLVRSGLYALVRHPQYLASDVLALAVMCITQHWAVYVVGTLGIATNHLTMTKADRDLIEKFGESYIEYMEQVPQWNPFVGPWRCLGHRRGKGKSAE